MKSKEFLGKVNDKFTVKGRELIIEFFFAFSRFECALKQSIKYANCSSDKVEPNWDKFASEIKDIFDPNSSKSLKEAVDYLISNPPKKQYLDNSDNTLKWKDRVFTGTEPLTNKLGLMIRDIRNNLFHGGKFNGIFSEETSRNYKLLDNALIILNNWLKIDSTIGDLFMEPIS